jgi:hypothetical protein
MQYLSMGKMDVGRRHGSIAMVVAPQQHSRGLGGYFQLSMVDAEIDSRGTQRCG